MSSEKVRSLKYLNNDNLTDKKEKAHNQLKQSLSSMVIKLYLLYLENVLEGECE